MSKLFGKGMKKDIDKLLNRAPIADGEVRVNTEKLEEVMTARGGEAPMYDLRGIESLVPEESPVIEDEVSQSWNEDKQMFESEPTVVLRPLTDARKNELTERFNGMSREEMELFADIMPIELCLNRIHKELAKAKEFEETVKTAMNMLR